MLGVIVGHFFWSVFDKTRFDSAAFACEVDPCIRGVLCLLSSFETSTD